MGELRSGTVSLLFSDIEGSTALLSRLGPAYAESLDGHREVLRKAWASHGGTELGTQGDSFFVVFPTAGAAVSAAAQAQRGLAEYPWPGGERVRVRIGIHTGSPGVHAGEYVGMDVHRAARIAASAHGGQVVVSSATADLARGSLPDGVRLRDLGSHQLKDITVPEHLFQATIDGLQTDFAPLKTLGAASRLPIPATPLVGRDGELAVLLALLRSPGVRLVTLTGPGGSGKTRLAIALAQRLVEVFPDGVFFVPLASVTSADVMWTSIAEVLDVPPKGRTPPGFFDYVAHRSALFVLDNLEQLPGADDVVAQLLAAAQQMVVIASSRRALSVPAEHLHPVPPLELPEDSTLAAAERSGAVQLFVQQARMIRPGFQLTAENAADVVAICRQLDGLPLAIELSAARIRLLSPKALLGRLDQALDIASAGRQGPRRQKTLRDTIAWSYDLLTPAQQAFFRRQSVFAGGGDLDAIIAVITDPGDCADPLNMVADLVDASLATITEGPDGEPRVAMLETIRAYARDRLRATGEADAVRHAHAEHYLQRAKRLRSLRESQHLVARGLAEIELDNFREALGWTLQQANRKPTGSGGVSIGLQLCSALGWLWLTGGYLTEGRRWYEHAIERADESPSSELTDCLGGLANLLISQGESKRAQGFATSSLTMARTLGDKERIAFALGVLGTALEQLGDVDAARRTLEEALSLHRQSGNRGRLAKDLGNLAGIEETLGHFDRAEALTQESLTIVQGLGDMHEAAIQAQNLAYLLAITGRVGEANQRMKDLIETVLKLRSPNLTIAFANTCMNILIRLGDPVRAAHLFGAEEAMRERNAMQNPYQQEELQQTWSLARDLISAEDWDYHCRLGRGETVEDLLTQLSTS
jgi:predicted ATPase/class 3 adenylate cyclase